MSENMVAWLRWRIAQQEERCADTICLNINDIVALADVLEPLATMDPVAIRPRGGTARCFYCDAVEGDWGVDHAPDCAWLTARRLCGMEDAE